MLKRLLPPKRSARANSKISALKDESPGLRNRKRQDRRRRQCPPRRLGLRERRPHSAPQMRILIPSPAPGQRGLLPKSWLAARFRRRPPPARCRVARPTRPSRRARRWSSTLRKSSARRYWSGWRHCCLLAALGRCSGICASPGGALRLLAATIPLIPPPHRRGGPSPNPCRSHCRELLLLPPRRLRLHLHPGMMSRCHRLHRPRPPPPSRWALSPVA